MYCKQENQSQCNTSVNTELPLGCKSGAGPWGKQQPAEAAGKSAVGKLAAGRRLSGAAGAVGRSAAGRRAAGG